MRMTTTLKALVAIALVGVTLGATAAPRHRHHHHRHHHHHPVVNHR